MTNQKPDNCKKCGASGFYYPQSEGDEENGWPKVDKWGNIEAFDPKYRVPHWYVCQANSRSKENIDKLNKQRSITTSTAIPKTEDSNTVKVNYFKNVVFSPDIVAQIIIKMQVIELSITEIKQLLAQAQEQEY